MKLTLREALELVTGTTEGIYHEHQMDQAVRITIERGKFTGVGNEGKENFLVISEAKIYIKVLGVPMSFDINREDIEAEIFRLKMEKV